jgi:manganese/iron transport system permease protein
VTPAAAARQLTDRLPVMMLLSGIIGSLSGVVGLFVSFHQDVAAGGTIVLVATVIFMAVWLFSPQHGLLMTRVLQRRMAGALQAESTVLYESAQLHPPGH